MSNKFGIKDFLLFVLLGVLVVMVWLGMLSKDRTLLQTQDAESRLEQLSESVSTIRGDLRELRNDVRELRRTGVAVSSGGGESMAAGDSSWARPGVEIEWSEPWTGYFTDPGSIEGAGFGGECIELVGSRVPKLTPYVENEYVVSRIWEMVLEPLAIRHRAEPGRFVGVLAAGWQVAPDGRWVRVRLREEATFSDGHPVRAEDIAFTFDFWRNPQIDADVTRSLWDNVTGLEVIDELTVEFTFSNTLFRNKITVFDHQILPKHFYEQFEPNEINESTGLLMGSGPFRLERVDAEDQYTPGDDVVLVRNDNYWAAPARLDSYRWKRVDDPSSRLTEFINGGAHFIEPMAEQFADRRNNPDFLAENDAVMWFPLAGSYYYIGWNNGERMGQPSLFTDRRVRQALTMLIDRDRIIRDIFSGLGKVARGPFPQGHPAEDPTIEPWPYDTAAAERLLAEAGVIDRDGDGIREDRDGRPMIFDINLPASSANAKRIGEYMQEQLGRFGFDATAKPTDWPVLLEMVRGRDFDVSMMGWAMVPTIDPKQIWHSDSIAGQGSNHVQFANPEADRLIDLGRTIVDDDERMRVWHQLHALIHEEQPYTFLYVRPELVFKKNDLVNVQPYANRVWRAEFAFRTDALASN